MRFSAYGQITDVYLKQNCEPGRQWAFIIYSSAKEAQEAKEATDRSLMLPGASKPCEVRTFCVRSAWLSR